MSRSLLVLRVALAPLLFAAVWRVARAVLDELGFRLFAERFGAAAVAPVVEALAPVVALVVTLCVFFFP